MAKTELRARVFVGERPLEELTDEEREAFADKVAQRIGETFNTWFGTHPEEYAKVKEVSA